VFDFLSARFARDGYISERVRRAQYNAIRESRAVEEKIFFAVLIVAAR